MTHEEVIKQFTPIIQKMAYKHSKDKRSLSDFEDLVSVGCMAAIEAYDTFDPEKASLVTRAFWLINNRMQIERDGMKNLKRGHNNWTTRLAKAFRELGPDATDEQIIKWSKKIHKNKSTQFTKVNLPHIRRIMGYKYGSLDRLMALPNGIGERYLPKEQTSFEEHIENRQHQDLLYEMMKDVLTEKEGFVLRMRLREISLEEIAGHLSVTRERIRQMEAKALKKLSDRVRFKLRKKVDLKSVMSL